MPHIYMESNKEGNDPIMPNFNGKADNIQKIKEDIKREGIICHF